MNLGCSSESFSLKAVSDGIVALELVGLSSPGNESWGRSRQNLGNSFTDLIWGDLIDLRGIGVPFSGSKGGEASSSLFESISLFFKSEEDISLQDIFGSIQFISRDGGSDSLQAGNGVIQNSLGIAGRSRESESEKTGVREMGIERSSRVNIGLLGSQSIESISVEESGGELESPSVSGFPVGSLEIESDSNRVILSQISDFSTLILSSFSSFSAVSSWNIRELVLSQVNELLVVVNTGSSNENFAWGDILELELLEDVAGEVSDVALESLEWETESLKSEGGSENGLVEVLTSLQELIELVRILVLGLSDLSSND